jgi:hypothetical protein
MSVHDREPRVPNDDTGRGLRVLGWMLVVWAVFSMIWAPPRVFSTRIAMLANAACFIGGMILVVIGYGMSWLAPTDVELAERTHQMMEATHSGNQLEAPLFANTNGPGLDPKRIA